MQTFDELIREITINCAERGFLLARVKDEIKMTIQAYQTLFESSIAFGMRKSLQAEQRKAEITGFIHELEDDNVQLKGDVEDLEHEINQLLVKEQEEIEYEKTMHAQGMQEKKDENQGLIDKVKANLLEGMSTAEPQ